MSCASPSGDRTLVAKPTRCTPRPSSTTVEAVCSESAVCGWMPYARHSRCSCALVAERPAHAAVHVLPERERAGAPRRVVGRVDADGDDRHVVAEVVERDADLLQRQRAGVLAGRVEERHDDGLAAHVGDPQRCAALVAHAEVRRAPSPAGGSRRRTPRRARCARRPRTAARRRRRRGRAARRRRGRGADGGASAQQRSPRYGHGDLRWPATTQPARLRSARAGSRSGRARRGRASRACA